MKDIIVKDLLKNKAMQVHTYLEEFNRNAGWAGYFFDGEDAAQLAAAGKYENTPKHGLHITVWHRNHGNLGVHEFLKTVMDANIIKTKVLGYADDGKNQAILVEKPPAFLTPAIPHVTISWVQGGNAAASGYMQFGSAPDGIPKELHGGYMKFIMTNGKEMLLDGFQDGIRKLELERMNEIASKLPTEVKTAIDEQKTFDQLSWDILKDRFISNGIEFNENMALLYAQYLVDTTDSIMPSHSAKEKELLADDAAHDKATDEQHDADEEKGEDID